MLPLWAISNSNKRRNGALHSRRNAPWMSRAQKLSSQPSMAAPTGAEPGVAVPGGAAPAGSAATAGGQQEFRQPSVQHPPPDVGHPELLQVEQRHRGEPDAAYASRWRGDRGPAASGMGWRARVARPDGQGRCSQDSDGRKPARRQPEQLARIPQPPHIVQDNGPPLQSPEKRLGPRQQLAGRRRRAVEEVGRGSLTARRRSRPRQLGLPGASHADD